MKQIVNWTFGSFFRTLGKVLLFVCIGFIIANLVDLGAISSNFKITDLFGLQTVNASSTDIGYIKDVQLFSINLVYSSTANPLCTSDNQSMTQNCSFVKNYDFDYNYYHNTGDNQFMLFRFYYVISSDNTTGGIVEFSPSATIYTVEGPSYNCQIENGLIICPLKNNLTYNRLRIRGAVYYNILNNDIRWQIDNWAQIYKNIIIDSNNQTQNSINQQTQQQAQDHNETMQTITDTNTTSDSSSANNFILNQQDDTPNGLTAAVTAPLTIMQNLILASNTPLCFTLNGKQTCIPDGYTLFWGRSQSAGRHWFDSGQFNPRAAFITLFNLVVGGFLCYKMLLSMLRIYNDMLDPTNSKIEVLKL